MRRWAGPAFAVMVLAAQNSHAASGDALVEVSVPELGAQEREGEAWFNKFCADCHGTNAAGVDGKGPPLVHRIYEPGHHGDAAFYLAPRQGVRAHHWPFGDMQPLEVDLTDAAIERIVTYVRALQRANGIN